MERRIDLNTISMWGDDIHFRLQLDEHVSRVAISRNFLLSIRPAPGDIHLPAEKLLLAKIYDIGALLDAAASSAEQPIIRIGPFRSFDRPSQT